MANRYQQLLREIPRGTFYHVTGEVLPTRSSPYELRFETAAPSTRFGIFVNGQYRGLTDTDAQGVALLSLTLERGRQDIELLNETTQQRFRAYLTIRNYATWMAAHADVFETIDDQITEMRDALSIESVTSLYAGDVYGRALRHPNASSYLIGAYRNVLQEVRQAYRLWGGRLAGLRQVVHAVTASLPFVVPKAWRPRWTLDAQLGSDWLTRRSTLDDDTFPVLNARAVSYVLASSPDNVSPATGPVTQPFTAEPLTVTFDAAYVASAAGDVIIEGLDQTGQPITETFVKPGLASTVQGVNQYRFTQINVVRLTALGAGAGTFTVGLAESRYVRLVRLAGPHVVSGTTRARTLDYFDASLVPGTFDALQLDGGTLVSIPRSGEYVVRGDFGRSDVRIDGLARVTPPGGTVDYQTRRRLALQLDDKGVVSVELGTPPATLAAVATAINARLLRELSLGAVPSTGLITVTAGGSILEDQTIQISDGFGNTLTLQADSDDTVTVAGYVPFDRTGSNTDIRDSILAAINGSGLRVRAYQTNGVNPAITLVNYAGGAAGIAAIASTVTGISVVGMLGGVDAPADYANRALVLSHSANGDVLQLLAGASSEGPAASVRVLPRPVDAAYDLLGVPRDRTALAAAASVGDLDLDCSGVGTDRMPEIPAVVLHASLSSALLAAPGPFTQPDWVTPVELWFSADYDGGAITVLGTDCAGDAVLEILPAPDTRVVDEGTSANGRGASSPGVLASITLSDVGVFQIWNLTDPGTAGNSWNVNITSPGTDPGPLIDVTALSLNIKLGTNFVLNLAETMVADINQNFGTLFRAGLISAGQFNPGTPLTVPFAGGIDDGQGVHLTRVSGRPGENAFLDSVRPGMLLRLLTGTYAGQTRRIVYVGQALGDVGMFPDATYDAVAGTNHDGPTRALLLDSSFGLSFWEEDWEIIDAQVVTGTQPFKTVTGLNNSVAGTAGRVQLRIMGGVEDFGVPLLVGRGQRAAQAADATVTPAATGDARATVTLITHAPSPDDSSGQVRISGAAAFLAANAGVHTLDALDPFRLATAFLAVAFPGVGFDYPMAHELAQIGGAFALRPNTPTDYSSFVPESGLDWELFSPGEPAVMVGNDRGTGVVQLAEPGLNRSKALGLTVERTEAMPVQQQGLAEAPDEMVLAVDTRLTPVPATAQDALTVRGQLLPDGWLGYNLDLAASTWSTWARTQATGERLYLVGDGGSVFGLGPILETHISRAAEFVGQTLRVSFWVEQMVAASADVRIDVSFDGGFTYSLGTPQTLAPRVGQQPPVLGQGWGGGDPEQVLRDVEVPTDITDMCIRLAFTSATTEQFMVEQVTVVSVQSTGYFLGQNTIPRHETHGQFGELLYVWSPRELLSDEREVLGVPDPAADEATVETPGHIDRITNAHGYWERVDVSEYDGSGLPVNVKGIYTETDWLSATLTNMTLEVQTPGRLSFVRPSRVSLVEGEILTLEAPSNATLSLTSKHRGLFPQAASGFEQLRQNGVFVPSTAAPGTRASGQIGTALGANGTVTVTFDRAGKEGENYTLTVDAATGTDRTLRATLTKSTGTILVQLAARDGALVADQNRATLVAAAIDALDDVSATALPGNGTLALNAAEGPIALSGAQALPWRFISATQIQIASLAAGDGAADAFYQEGNPPQATVTPYYDASTAYVLDYEVLIEADSGVIDLGVTHADYLWLIDVAAYRRVEPELTSHERTQQLLFRGDFTAALDEPSDQDQTTSTLSQDTGLARSDIRAVDFEYVNDRTIRIDGSTFNANAIYTLTYRAETARFARVPDLFVEHRSAPTELGLGSAEWVEVELDQAVGRPGGTPHRYHQIRVRLEGVIDVRDARIKSMGLRGLHLYGASAVAPGIITCDER